MRSNPVEIHCLQLQDQDQAFLAFLSYFAAFYIPTLSLAYSHPLFSLSLNELNLAHDFQGDRFSRYLSRLMRVASVKVASNLFELIVIICAYSVLIFDGQRASNAATLYK